MAIKLEEKYKIINIDLRKRLHVENPINNVYAVTGIDDGYFRDISVDQYIPRYKSLNVIFNNKLRTRQEIGYRRDCVLKIEEHYRRERQTYEYSFKKYTEQVKQFDAFISEDYKKSMAYLKNAGVVEVDVNAKILELEYLANKQFTIQSRLVGLDFLYFTQQKYGRFLYYLSPPSWRARHRDFARSVEIEAKGFDLGTSSAEDTFKVIFEKMQNECFSGLVKPVLYFSHPDDLMNMFETIEKHQLHYFTHVALLAPHAKMLKETTTTLKNTIERDSASVAHRIAEFEMFLDSCEERENQLQTKFMRILYGLFYDTVAAKDVLKLKMNLQFCYEKLYTEKQSNVNIVHTAKALEKMYMQYSYRLDDINNDNITGALKQSIKEEKTMMKRAHAASRELHLFDKLEHALLRAYKERNTTNVSPLPALKLPQIHKPRCRLRIRKSTDNENSLRELTEAEVEYLTILTDWMENENPAEYLQGF